MDCDISTLIKWLQNYDSETVINFIRTIYINNNTNMVSWNFYTLYNKFVRLLKLFMYVIKLQYKKKHLRSYKLQSKLNYRFIIL